MGSAKPAEAQSVRLLLIHFLHLGRILDALGRFLVVTFAILGALGYLSGAIFSPSRVLKRLFAKF